jgi:HEAT repeat protein
VKSLRFKLCVMLASLHLALTAGLLAAGETAPRVIGYRNDYTGVYADAKPPLTWKATVNDPENVVWRMPLPGPAETAQPIIVGDRIIVMSQPFYLSCFDKMTGKLLWEHRAHARADAKDQEERKAFLLERYVNYMMDEVIARFGCTDPCLYGRPLTRSERYVHSMGHIGLGKANLNDEQKAKLKAEFDAIMAKAPATWEGSNVLESAVPNRMGGDYDAAYTALATPVTDGKRIYAHFATGVAVCYDLEGRRQWIRLLLQDEGGTVVPPPASGGYNHATPVVADGRLYLPRRRVSVPGSKDKSTRNIFCLDAATGATAWVKPIGKMAHVGLISVVRGGVTWIVGVNGGIFLPDGTAPYGWNFFGVGSGGNSGPMPTLDRDTGALYHPSSALRLPDQMAGAPITLWNLEKPPRGGHDGTAWLAQHVPPGESPLPVSRLAEARARSEEHDRGRSFRGSVRNHAAPVVHKGVLYHFNSAQKDLSASDVSQDVLENMFYSRALPQLLGSCKPGKTADYLHSPHIYGDLAIAGDYLYVPGCERTAVLRVGKQFDLLAVNEHEPMVGTLVFDGDRIYVRGVDHLYCLGGPNPTERLPSLKPAAAPPTKQGFPVLARRLIDETLPRLLPILWNLDAEETVKLLEGQLKDGNRAFRNVVLLEELGRMQGDRSAALPLLRKALPSGHWARYRVQVLYAMASLGPAAAPAVPDLIEALKENSPLVRRYIARALGAIGPAAREAIPALEKLLGELAPEEGPALAKEVRLALDKIRSGQEAPTTAPNARKPLRALFIAHYGGSGTLPHFEAIHDANYPDRRVVSWFQSSGIKADVTTEWEKQTGLAFIRKEYTPDRLPKLEDGLGGGERVSGDWAPNARNRAALQARLTEFVAAGPDIVVIAVASDNSYLKGRRQDNDVQRVEALNKYAAEVRKAGARPVVLMAPQGVRPPQDPQAAHPDEQPMIQMAAALDALAVPAGLAMTRIMRDQPTGFWYGKQAPDKAPDGWYRHPGKCDNYVSAAILAVAIEDAKLAKAPEPALINALIANQAYGDNAPTYTAEMLATMHTVAYETWTDFKAKVATARAPKAATQPDAAAFAKQEKFAALARQFASELAPWLLPEMWELDATAAAGILSERLASGREDDNKALLNELGKMTVDRTAVLPALVKVLRTGKDPWYRATAAGAMQTMGPAAAPAIPDLIAALEAEEECVRRYAAGALGAIGPKAKDAIPALEKLLADPSKPPRTSTNVPTVAQAAATAIAKIKAAP